MNEKTVWESYTEEDRKKVYDFCEEYRTFLSKCKTERECVKEILKEAEAKCYRSLKEVRSVDDLSSTMIGRIAPVGHTSEQRVHSGRQYPRS